MANITSYEDLMEELVNKVFEPKTDGRLFQISMARVIQEILNCMRKGLWYDQLYIVGSVPEGLPFVLCSDLDFMKIKQRFPVVFWQSQIKWERQSRDYVMAEQNPNEPAYVMLRVASTLGLHEDVMRSIDDDGYLRNTYFMNTVCRDMSTPLIRNRSIHGPSLACLYPIGQGQSLKVDMVYCLKCQSWPPITSDFFNRKRMNDWPSQVLLDKLAGLDCLVVPVGHPNSESKDIEWRLSFSVAEKELIHNLYEPYAKCMLALKIVKHMYILYSDSDKPTPFCTYFLKTACFWMCETFPHERYSIVDLIKKVLDWLIYRYQERHLPHYFIPKQNLIGHISEEQCDDVSTALTSVRTSFFNMVDSWVDDGIPIGDAFLANFFIVNDNFKITKMDDEKDDDFKTLSEFDSLNHSYEEWLENAASFLLHRVIHFENSQIEEWVESDFGGVMFDQFIPTHHHSEILRFLEEIIIPVVEVIEKIVAKECVEMMKAILYRKLGDVYTHLLIFLQKKYPHKDLALYQNKPLHYYKLGAEMVFLDKWSDKGIGGQALVVKYHYLMRNHEALKGALIECKPIFMKSTENEDVMNRLPGIVVQLSADSFVTRSAWAVDKNVLELAERSSGYIVFHPIVFVFYIMARVSLKEGDRENASAIVKTIEECLRKIHSTDKREVNKSLIEFIEIEILEVTRMLGLYHWNTLKPLNRLALVHILNQPIQ